MDVHIEHIEDDEVLLRRVPPLSDHLQTIFEIPGGGFRATTIVMSTKPEEAALSCSRLRLFHPRGLLNDLRNDGIDPQGWYVCQFSVSDVRGLGLAIEFTPTDRDPGHCSITAIGGLAYPKSKAQKLARRTHILTEEEIDAFSQDA